MKKVKINIYLLCCYLALSVAAASQDTVQGNHIDLYLIPFENRTEDVSMDWLRNGFMDMVATHYQFSTVVTVHFEKDLNRLIKGGKSAKSEGFHYLLVGNYSSDADTLVVELQLLNALNWLAVDLRKLRISRSDFSLASDRLSSEVDDMLRIQYKMNLKPKEAQKETPPPEPVVEKKTPVFQEHAKKVKKQLDVAVRDLETTLDEYLGYKPEEKKDRTFQEGTYYIKDFRTAEIEENSAPDNTENKVYSLEKVLTDITSNPYLVEIGDLEFEGIPLNPDYIRIRFPVKYGLKKELLEEMLQIVPLGNVNRDANSVSYELRKDIFRMTETSLKKISRGEYRIFPVIELVSPDEKYRVRILDIPRTFYFRYEKAQPLQNIASFMDFEYTVLKAAPNIYFTTLFKPMLIINSSLYSVTVYLNEAESQTIIYTIDVPMEVMSRITRIKVHFENEENIQKIIFQS